MMECLFFCKGARVRGPTLKANVAVDVVIQGQAAVLVKIAMITRPCDEAFFLAMASRSHDKPLTYVRKPK